MAYKLAEDLTEYLERRAGDYLRGVVFYDESDYDVLTLREDLRRKRLESEVDQMIGHLQRESRAREQRTFPFGELNGTVRSFEEAVVMHFPLTQSQGVVVTLDPEAARQLNTFMGECIDRL